MMEDDRRFTSASGESWRVHEEPTASVQGSDGTTIDAEHRAELWFTSSRGERRVLADVPREWRAASEETLARYCEQARIVEREAP